MFQNTRVNPVYMPLMKSARDIPVYQDPITPSTTRSGGDVDIVQFAARIFYVNESEGHAEIKVLRIGQLNGTCSVSYHTENASAHDGYKYTETCGTLHFAAGEHTQRIHVPILEDDTFDTTLEFNVHLESPSRCAIEPIACTCRVLILDDDYFPSNDFKEQIESKNEQNLHKVGLQLLKAYLCFCWHHVPGIRWKSIQMLLMAQFGNVYYLFTIFIRVYLVDRCLNMNFPEDQLMIKGQRWYTALLLGAAWILPNVIITASDFFECAVLEMGFSIRRHLRVNLFRKYLNYTADSRSQVPVQDLKTSMMEDIPDVVSNGYLVLFSLWQIFGKIACVATFMFLKDPMSLLVVVVYPIMMSSWIALRHEKRMSLLTRQGEGESETQGALIHAANSHRLITDYKQRGLVVRKFEDSLQSQRHMTMDLKKFKFWNDTLIPWITLICIGGYMGIYAKYVIEGTLGLGSYLATINVFKDLGDRFGGVYDGFSSLAEALEPLVGLTVQLNLPTDLPHCKSIHKYRDDWVEYMLRQKPADSNVPIYDQIPIALKDVMCEHSPCLKDQVSAQVPQGNIVVIKGPHESGKATIIRVLCDNSSEHQGIVFCPRHLRFLHVGNQPFLTTSLSLYKNLTFGFQEKDEVDIVRVRGILRRLGLGSQRILDDVDRGSMEATRAQSLNMSPCADLKSKNSGKYEADDSSEDFSIDGIGEEEDEEDKKDGWDTYFSYSEIKRLHLARAFIYNPEVLVMNRPLDELDSELADKVMELLREFVDSRGVEMDSGSFWQRRPRTVFYSCGNASTRTNIADIVWNVGKHGLVCEQGSRRLG